MKRARRREEEILPFCSPRRARLRAPATRPNTVLSSLGQLTLFLFSPFRQGFAELATINRRIDHLSFQLGTMFLRQPSRDACPSLLGRGTSSRYPFILIRLRVPCVESRFAQRDFRQRETILREYISSEVEATLKINSCQFNGRALGHLIR